MQPAARLRLELRLAKARRWKWSSVRLVEKKSRPRRCLWAMSMSADKNNKNRLSGAVLFRVAQYLTEGAEWVLAYLQERADSRYQWAYRAARFSHR